MDERKPYKTDLTEPEWVVIKRLIAAWKAKHRSVRGHRGRYSMREIVNALRYQNRTGCQWELPPFDLPPSGAVHPGHSHSLVPRCRPPSPIRTPDPSQSAHSLITH